MLHRMINLSFASVVPESWNSFPRAEELKREIALTVLTHSELSSESLGVYAPPETIKEVRITTAAFDQIRCMWHGHREKGHQAPPLIPLKVFVFSFGQDASGTWASIEVMPGLDDWELE